MLARSLQINLIVSLVLISWLAMQAVHESGHVVGAWCTGGHVAKNVGQASGLTFRHSLSTAWRGTAGRP
jgi:hypothetical protein